MKHAAIRGDRRLEFFVIVHGLRKRPLAVR
jgi:hypothetical protein